MLISGLFVNRVKRNPFSLSKPWPFLIGSTPSSYCHVDYCVPVMVAVAMADGEIVATMADISFF